MKTSTLQHDLFAGFEAALQAAGRRPKTIASYRSDWTGYCEWQALNRPRSSALSSLGGATVTAYKASLESSGLTASTVNRKLVFLKRFADWAHRAGLIDERVSGEIRAVPAASQAPRRPSGLSDIELRRLMREVERRAGPRDEAIVHTLVQTGLRVGELVALRREQIGLGERSGFIRVDGKPEGMGRARRVAVKSTAREKLRAYLVERGDGDGPLFLGERGPLTANAVQRLVRKYGAFAKVSASPQVLRHTFAASYLAEHDGDLVGLADALGHESIETTRLYLHTVPVTTGPRKRALARSGRETARTSALGQRRPMTLATARMTSTAEALEHVP